MRLQVVAHAYRHARRLNGRKRYEMPLLEFGIVERNLVAVSALCPSRFNRVQCTRRARQDALLIPRCHVPAGFAPRKNTGTFMQLVDLLKDMFGQFKTHDLPHYGLADHYRKGSRIAIHFPNESTPTHRPSQPYFCNELPAILGHEEFAVDCARDTRAIRDSARPPLVSIDQGMHER